MDNVNAVVDLELAARHLSSKFEVSGDPRKLGCGDDILKQWQAVV